MTDGTGADGTEQQPPGEPGGPALEQRWAPWGSVVPEPPPWAPPAPPADPPPPWGSPRPSAGTDAQAPPSAAPGPSSPPPAPPAGPHSSVPAPPGGPYASPPDRLSDPYAPPTGEFAHPYGPPAGGPYGWQYRPGHPVYGLGYPASGPPSRPQSGLAVAALVCGLVSILFPPLAVLGLDLAIVALVHLRGGRERGRALAVGGLVASLVWPALLALGGFAAFSLVGPALRQAAPEPFPEFSVPCDGGTCPDATDEEETPTFVDDLAPGDCLSELPASLRDDADDTTVDVVDCTDAHRAQVVDTVTSFNGPYPGDEAVRRQSELLCGLRLPAGVKAEVAAGRGRIVVAYPGEQAWEETQDSVCLLVTPGPTTSDYDLV